MPHINIFLSDLHIGVNAPTNLYQKTVHQKYLKAILKYIQDKGPQIQDLIILGDWLELCAYLPNSSVPSVKDIFNNNSDIFTPTDKPGDFVSCLDSIRGHFYFINGNHDLTVSANDINSHFRPLSKYGREIKLGTFRKDIYQSGEIHAEHGHRYSLFCRADCSARNRYKPWPFGYYLARTAALVCKQKLIRKRRKNAALLPGSGNPVFGIKSLLYSVPYILDLLAGKMTLAQAVLFDFASLAGETDPETFLFAMPDGSRITAADAAGMFPHLSVIHGWKGLLADATDELDRQGEALCRNHRVVVMGDTHTPKMVQYHVSPIRRSRSVNAVYVNTGFLCASKPELWFKRKLLSFVEVEQDRRKYVVRLKKVDYPSTNISTFAESTLY